MAKYGINIALEEGEELVDRKRESHSEVIGKYMKKIKPIVMSMLEDDIEKQVKRTQESQLRGVEDAIEFVYDLNEFADSLKKEI